MAIRFWEIYEETHKFFRLRILAGKGGMDHVVGWVHMLEDETIVSRFSGQELAVTTGMKAQEKDWLLHLVQAMQTAQELLSTRECICTPFPQRSLPGVKKTAFPCL